MNIVLNLYIITSNPSLRKAPKRRLHFMETYELNYRAKYIYMVYFLIAAYFLISFYLEFNLNKQNSYIAIGTLVLFIIPSHFIAEHFAKTKVKLFLNSSYFDIYWLKLPYFVKRENRSVPWSKIENYTYEEEEDKLSFTAKLIDGEKLTILADPYQEQKESFRDFRARFEKYHKKLTKEEVRDYLEYNKRLNKNFYQTKIAKIIASTSVIICVIYILYLVFFIEPSKIKFKLAFLPIVTTVFFVEQVWSNRKIKVNYWFEEIRVVCPHKNLVIMWKFVF